LTSVVSAVVAVGVWRCS